MLLRQATQGMGHLEGYNAAAKTIHKPGSPTDAHRGIPNAQSLPSSMSGGFKLTGAHHPTLPLWQAGASDSTMPSL